MKNSYLIFLLGFPITSYAAPDFQAVDAYKSSNELLKHRKSRNEKVDVCVSNETPINSFSDSIDNAINYSLTSRNVKDSYYRSAYKLVAEESKAGVGLFSHRMCELDDSEIKHMFSEEKDYPTEQTLAQMKRFVHKYNEQFVPTLSIRNEILNSEKQISSLQQSVLRLDSEIRSIESRKNRPLNRNRSAQARFNAQIEQLTIQKNYLLQQVQSLEQNITSNNNRMSQNKDNVKHLYRAFFGCLAYTESLSDPDTAKSNEVYSNHVVGKFVSKDLKKPDGVKYYEDRPAEFINTMFGKRDELKPLIYAKLLEEGKSEEEAEKLATAQATAEGRAYAVTKIPRTWLGIGLYQYTTASSSSATPCLQQWNDRFSRHSGCSVRQNNESEHVNILGSAQQTFNAFCGVHRLSTQFDTMVNSSEARRTSPANIQNGALKNGNDRCVSIFASPRKFFVHYSAFGNLIPVINNGHGNLGILMSCVDQSLKSLKL